MTVTKHEKEVSRYDYDPRLRPWTEHPAGTDEEKRLASAQQSKTSPLSVDKEHETGVFYGSGKEPYQPALQAAPATIL